MPAIYICISHQIVVCYSIPHKSVIVFFSKTNKLQEETETLLRTVGTLVLDTLGEDEGSVTISTSSVIGTLSRVNTKGKTSLKLNNEKMGVEYRLGTPNNRKRRSPTTPLLDFMVIKVNAIRNGFRHKH